MSGRMLGEIPKAKPDSISSSSGSVKQSKRSELLRNTKWSTSSFDFPSSIVTGLFVLSLVVLILKSSPLEIRASDDEYSQAVQSDFLTGENAGSFLRTRRLDSQNQTDQTNSTSGGQKNGTCVVNAARTGIDCNSVLLRDLSTGSTKSGVYADLSRTFDPDSKLFETTGTVYLSYLNVTRQVIMNFEFNSSTPDGTILSQGSTPLGTIAVPLSVVNVPTNFGLSQIPYLPVDVNVVHQAVLSRDPEVSDSGSGSTSTSSCGPNLYCESGSVTGTIGLIANGAVVVPQQFTLIVNVSEPTSGAFNLPFNDTIGATSNSTTYCDSLSFSSKATQDLTVRVQVCLPQAPCFGEDQTFAVGQDNQTLTNDLCFTPSFHLATNSTNGGGSGSNTTTHAPTTAAPGNSTTGGGF